VSAAELLDLVRVAVGRRAVFLRVPDLVARPAAAACDVVGRLTGRGLPFNRWRYLEMCAEGFVCSVERLHARLGVVAQVELGDGLAETAAWYRRVGWIA
jgi:nucleoside-diphosphate-sugar epimerase